MKKVSLFIIIVLMFSSICLPAAYADNTVVECSGLNIVIDGIKQNFSKVPIAVNNSTLLPLRELLVSLGVPNDNDHIIWSTPEKSVTIYKDLTKVNLKLGDLTAFVNDSPIKLDAAPASYKGSTYIPTRFVAQTLGKKVIWDCQTSTVFIKGEEDFKNVKSIFDQVEAANKTVKKYKLSSSLSSAIEMAGKTYNLTTDSDSNIDLEKKLRYDLVDTSSDEVSTKKEYYITENAAFYKELSATKWQKLSITQAQINSMFGLSMQNMDILYAGLVPASTPDDNKIILKGSIYRNEIIDSFTTQFSSFGLKLKPSIKNSNMEIVIDKKTNSIISITFNFNGDLNISQAKTTISGKVVNTYDFATDFEISLPDEIK